MRSRFFFPLFLALFTLTTASAAIAQGNVTTFTVLPTSSGFDQNLNHVLGAPLDAAPGFESGSWQSDGIGKTAFYANPAALFGHDVKVGDIATLSYWTNDPQLHSVRAGDWYLQLYTKPCAGQLVARFYCARITAEPYFAQNPDDAASEWRRYSTDGATNTLPWFDSANSYFGGYGDPLWNDFKERMGLLAPSVAYKDQTLLYLSLQTGSGWASGFTGKVDGISVKLVSGEEVRLNLEAFLSPTAKDMCKGDGWKTVLRPDGSQFKNQGDCVSYVAAGK
jgi:hypothetical protein